MCTFYLMHSPKFDIRYKKDIMSRHLCLVILVHFLTLGSTRADCPDNWVTFEGHCYLFSHELKNFTDAENDCIQRGSHLVQIETKAENLFLRSFCRELKTRNYWIGMSDLETEGTWIWDESNATVVFEDFYPGRPCCGRTTNCGVLWSAFDYRWADYYCNLKCVPICEKKTASIDEILG